MSTSSSSSQGPIIRPPSSSSSSSHSSSSRSSSTSSQPGFDPITAEPVQSRLLLLGKATPTLAVVRFTSLQEPLTADAVTVELNGPVASLEAIRIYALNGQLLATATRDASQPMRYRATISLGAFMINKGNDATIYIRGVLSNKDSGGSGGETIGIDQVTLEATGDWSTEHYSVTSTETLPASQTARGRITGIVTSANTVGNWPLTTGASQLLWDFNVSAETSDGEAAVRLSDLTFTLSQAGISLTNVRLQAADGATSTTCSVSSNQVICNSLPAGIGSIPNNSSVRLRVYGDVAIIGTPNLAYVQLSLGESGSVSAPGVITWTDGITTYDWVDLESPLGVGPRFTQ